MKSIDNLISDSTPPLRQGDTVEYALGLMMELHVRHLPIVDVVGKLIGLVSEDLLLDAAGPDACVDTVLRPRPVRVHPNTHVFDMTKVMMEHDLSTLPVVQEDDTYVGLVRRHDIFEWFAHMLRTHETGAILALAVPPRDYSLSKLVYTIEQNDVRVLSVATETPQFENEDIRVTLKLNVRDASRVKHMLEHHGYNVVAAFGEEEDDEDLLYRIQEFMRYLEV